MKKWAALLLLPLLLTLSACASTAVSYQISDDNRVDVGYSMTITPDGEDVTKYTDKITNYWESLGFTVETAEAEDTITLTGVKSTQCGSMQEAVDALAAMLTGEDSLLYNVEFNYEPAYLQDDFSLKASISLKDLLRHNEDSGLPAAEAEKLLNEAAKCEYTLSIALPGEVESTNADSQDGGVCTWNLKYGEERQIELSSSLVFENNVSYYNMLQGAHRRDTLLAIVFAALTAAALIATAIMLGLRARRRRIAKAAAIPPTWNAPANPNPQDWNPNPQGWAPAAPASQDWMQPHDPPQTPWNPPSAPEQAENGSSEDPDQKST